MKMVIRARDKDGRPAPEPGLVIEGPDCLALVEQMRAQTPFTARQTPDEYIEGLLARLPDKPPVRGNTAGGTGRGLPEHPRHARLRRVRGGQGRRGGNCIHSRRPGGRSTFPARCSTIWRRARHDGRTNMLDWPAVAEIAEVMGLEKTAVWVRTHQREYSAGIFKGFAAEKKGSESCADK